MFIIVMNVALEYISNFVIRWSTVLHLNTFMFVLKAVNDFNRVEFKKFFFPEVISSIRTRAIYQYCYRNSVRDNNKVGVRVAPLSISGVFKNFSRDGIEVIFLTNSHSVGFSSYISAISSQKKKKKNILYWRP